MGHLVRQKESRKSGGPLLLAGMASGETDSGILLIRTRMAFLGEDVTIPDVTTPNTALRNCVNSIQEIPAVPAGVEIFVTEWSE